MMFVYIHMYANLYMHMCIHIYMSKSKNKNEHIHNINMYYLGWDRSCLRKGGSEKEEAKAKTIYLKFLYPFDMTKFK